MSEEQQHDSKGLGGPKTEEGKAISSMNAVKYGKHIGKFSRIDHPPPHKPFDNSVLAM